MNSTLRSIKLVTCLTAICLAITLSPAASATSAKNFMKGGEYCFRVGTTIPGGWLTRLKLIVDPARGSAPLKIAHLDALERGSQATFPPNAYVTPLTGSATIAPPNEQSTGDNLLQISLTGADYGNNGNPDAMGIWSDNLTLLLNTANLTGYLKGVKDFTVITNGQLGESTKSVVDETVTTMPCSEF